MSPDEILTWALHAMADDAERQVFEDWVTEHPEEVHVQFVEATSGAFNNPFVIVDVHGDSWRFDDEHHFEHPIAPAVASALLFRGWADKDHASRPRHVPYPWPVVERARRNWFDHAQVLIDGQPVTDMTLTNITFSNATDEVILRGVASITYESRGEYDVRLKKRRKPKGITGTAHTPLSMRAHLPRGVR